MIPSYNINLMNDSISYSSSWETINKEI